MPGHVGLAFLTGAGSGPPLPRAALQFAQFESKQANISPRRRGIAGLIDKN
jgi:hypothetical protein